MPFDCWTPTELSPSSKLTDILAVNVQEKHTSFPFLTCIYRRMCRIFRVNALTRVYGPVDLPFYRSRTMSRIWVLFDESADATECPTHEHRISGMRRLCSSPPCCIDFSLPFGFHPFVRLCPVNVFEWTSPYSHASCNVANGIAGIQNK